MNQKRRPERALKIGVQTWGSDGDIRPFAALSGGLSAAGHEVTLAVTSVDGKDYSALGGSLGFEVRHVGGLLYDAYANREIALSVGNTSNPLKQFRIILDSFFEPLVDEMYEAAASLSRQNDIVVGHFIMHPLEAAARKAQRPHVTVSLNQSMLPTAHTPPFGFPDLGGWPNRMFWKLTVAVINTLLLKGINRLYEREGLGRAASYRDVWESRLLNLIAVSPLLCPHRPDWEAHHKVCGFLNVPVSSDSFRVPDDLMDFISSGPPPVYMTFGSMVSPLYGEEYVRETATIMVEAARLAGARAVIQGHWDLAQDIGEGPDIYRTGGVPHQAVFPHCSMVVHHGGAGTTQAATRAGVPSVVVAHIADQLFWGGQLKRLGVARGTLKRRTLTVARLAHAIRRVLDTPAMGGRAAEVGRLMRDEDGVALAVEAIEAATTQSKA